MKLTHEQAVYSASVFTNYFDRFNRIDEYMREQKLTDMGKRPTPLFGMGPEEDLFSDFSMSPNDMEFEIIELPLTQFTIYVDMISSHTNLSGPGRNLRLAVREKRTQKWIGFIRLSSPVINCRPRNEMLGQVIHQHAGCIEQFNNCAIMGFIIVPTQPFGFNYLGGKLLAAMCSSHEVRQLLDKKYHTTICLFETTSLYGSSKALSQYDGMKPLLRFKGLTVSDFLPMMHGKSYTDLKGYIEAIIGKELVPEIPGKITTSRKMRISSAMISLIKDALKGTPESAAFTHSIEKAKQLNEQKRYFIGDYGFSNMIDYVNLKAKTLIPGENYEKHNMINIIEWWKKKATARFETLKTDGRIRKEQEIWTVGVNERTFDIIR